MRAVILQQTWLASPGEGSAVSELARALPPQWTGGHALAAEARDP
jgi:hypothetical protein